MHSNEQQRQIYFIFNVETLGTQRRQGDRRGNRGTRGKREGHKLERRAGSHQSLAETKCI